VEQAKLTDIIGATRHILNREVCPLLISRSLKI
jgi:hypothetical protein